MRRAFAGSRPLFWLSLLLIPLAVLLFMVDPSTILICAGAVALAVLCLLLSVLAPRILTMLVARQVRKMLREGMNKNLLCMHELELTHDMLLEKTPFRESATALESIERVVTTDRYTFIYLSAMAALIIPRTSVAEGDYDAFVDALRDG